jgi:hypothetical protein
LRANAASFFFCNSMRYATVFSSFSPAVNQFLLDAEPGSKPHWWYSFVWKWDAPPNLVLQKLTFSVIVAINWGTLQAKTHPNIMLSLISSLHISSICYKIVLIFFFICLLAHHSVDYTYKYTYTYIYSDGHPLRTYFFHFFLHLERGTKSALRT